MNKSYSKFAGTFEDVQRNDLFFLNNPVLIQGLGLSPVIMAAISLKNAVILAIAAGLIGITTRYICGFLHMHTAFRLRGALYAFVASLAYMPTLALLNYMFGSDIRSVGIYLPLIVVDQIILARSESFIYERPKETIANSFTMSLGFGTVIVIVGALREFLAKGTLWGETIIKIQLLPIMNTAIGGFITVALLAALLQALISIYKKQVAGRSSHIVE